MAARWRWSHREAGLARYAALRQQAPGDGLLPARTLRHEPVLALEKKWTPKLYAGLTATGFVNAYAQGPTTANLFVDATLSCFLGLTTGCGYCFRAVIC
ncbi:MAG: hypothetical protein WKG07_47330 [Hymenobacter sp.]